MSLLCDVIGASMAHLLAHNVTELKVLRIDGLVLDTLLGSLLLLLLKRGNDAFRGQQTPWYQSSA
jgi:hypothetical protein